MTPAAVRALIAEAKGENGPTGRPSDRGEDFPERVVPALEQLLALLELARKR